MRPRVSRPFLLLSLLSLSLLPPCRSAPLDDFRQCVATPTQPADPVIGSTAALPAESGSLLTAADDGFAAAAATLNLNSQLLPPPAAIVYPTSTAQVARVVRCAVNASLPITVRGGAHSYISESSGGFKTAGVVIDLAGRGEGRGGMLKVDIDEAGGKAVVEAGNWVGWSRRAMSQEANQIPHIMSYPRFHCTARPSIPPPFRTWPILPARRKLPLGRPLGPRSRRRPRLFCPFRRLPLRPHSGNDRRRRTR